jgi:large subunit ribosomal protein L31
MKKDAHPDYYPEAKIKCACGAVFSIGATKKEIEIEVCSHCHPFFTGKDKFIDVAGRVEKFKEKIQKTRAIKSVKKTTSKTQKRKAQKKKKQAKPLASPAKNKAVKK